MTVLEQAPQLRTGGAAISVWNNGAMAPKRLGVTLESHGRVIDRLEMRSREGYVAAVVDARRLSRSPGIEAGTAGRGELLEHPASQLHPRRIRFDASCVGLDDSGDTPREQDNGGLWLSAELVVTGLWATRSNRAGSP